MTALRFATFNLENLDDKPGDDPPLAERLPLMRPQIARLRAHVACFQEVHGQETAGAPRRLTALDQLLAGTNLAGLPRTTTLTTGGEPYDERNLVVVSAFPAVHREQLRNDLVDAPAYRRVTAQPPDPAAKPVLAERPILYVQLDVGGRLLHVINVHLKSRLPSDIPGRKLDTYTWAGADAWAEGVFVSSMKRMAQALEVRRLVDRILDTDPDAFIIAAGDFNAAADEVPVKAIRSDVEDTGNPALAARVLVPVEHTIPEPSRYTLYHQGRGEMLDHILISRNLLAHYRGTEIHNELLHDESVAFAIDRKYPESDHAPVVATFELP